MKKFVACLLVITTFSAIAYAKDEGGSKSPDQYMADLSSDKDEKVVVEAVQWAGDKKKKETVDKLIVLLGDERSNVRLHAVIALGNIGDEKAVEAVNNSLLSDENAEVRYAAMLASFRIGSTKSIDTWKQAREKETDPYIQDFLKKVEEKALKKKK